MSVNGITNVNSTDAYKMAPAKVAAKASNVDSNSTEAVASGKASGVVYEKSNTSTQKYKPNAELIAKMKADADAQTANLQSLVQEMMSKQGSTLGKANDMWKFLAGGDYTVDAATKKQAQADIAADGYWGVNKTSDRVLDFAKALTGGDPSKIEKMRSAFQKGYKEATGAWGKELPSLSKDTYDATMKKFDQWAEESKNTAATNNNSAV
ncbi:MAG: hypothetical protein RRX92_00070 [Lachnospiraceae bacterium]